MEPTSALHTRPSLLLRLRDPRDTASWRTFVEIYAPLIYRYCRGRGLQDSDAADVGQEVLTQVARSMHTFTYQPERGRFRDWLGTVTRHKIARFVARRDRGERAVGGDVEAETLGEAVAPTSEAEWTAEFNTRLVQVALERVRPHFEAASWQAFTLVWVEHQPATKVARAVGLGIDAVYVAKSRVLKRLREEVLELAEDLPLLAE